MALSHLFGAAEMYADFLAGRFLSMDVHSDSDIQAF
jgi:hypothetical protein